MTLESSTRTSADQGRRFDVAIVGGGLAGVVALAYARRAGLDAVVLERQSRIGGLWRDLPAWQDIQIGVTDWALGDLPLRGAKQPHILANIEAWADRFGLTDAIRLNTPVQIAREDESGWELSTPQGKVLARHLVAATGSHNTPFVPPIERTASSVREFHSSALRDPGLLNGRDVLVVGAGASALDLLELCFEQAARRVIWAYRSTRWFMPTRKPKHIAGSVRGFARLQATGMTSEQLSAAIGADLRSRYAKFGLAEIEPSHDFDVLHDQLIPGRVGMLENYADIERHKASVQSISGSTVTLSNGQRVSADCLLWGTGYGVDLSYFESPAIGSIRTLDKLADRCGCIFRSLDAANLYFPGVILDGIGTSTWAYSMMFRSIMSHIKGTARFDNEVLAHRLNHIELVEFLAKRDPASFPPETWRAHYQAMVLDTPDEQPYPIP
jgi:Pyridine nucleotide-disulphide oxidoreductase